METQGLKFTLQTSEAINEVSIGFRTEGVTYFVLGRRRNERSPQHILSEGNI